jgi:uncharacterized protein YprB with RNaseH-like and TPR domain
MQSHSTSSVTPEITSTTIVGGPGSLFRRCKSEDRVDLDTTHNPDAYFLTGADGPTTGAKQVEYELPGQPTVLYPGYGQNGQARHVRMNGIDILSCPRYDDLQKVQQYESNGKIDVSTETVILSNLLAIEVEMDQLRTRMLGLQEYKAALQPESLNGSYSHLTGQIDAGYCREWDKLLVRGAGIGDGSRSSKFVLMDITSDGMVNDRTIDSGKLGLKAIQSVGPTTAKRLRQNGFASPETVANADAEDIKQLKGFGDKKTETVIKSATAFSEKRIVPTSDAPVPASNPIFIDIETDGLNPTCVWLIGVKDSANENYMSFIETDLDSNSKAITDFMMWFSSNAANRTLLAWNGWNFDFPVMRKHIQTHCPQYLDDWKRASKRDPLRWARDLGNAILPGRTNKLEHVAESLGWEDNDTGLSGAEVARRYREWMKNPSEQTALDWDRHKRYCQDDCEALEYIYKAMRNANRLNSTQTDRTYQNVGEETSQGTLFESY